MTEENEQEGWIIGGGTPAWSWKGRSRTLPIMGGTDRSVIFRYDGACRTANATIWSRENEWVWVVLDGEAEPPCGKASSSREAMKAVREAHAAGVELASRCGDRKHAAGDALMFATALGKGGSVHVQLDRIAASLAAVASEIQTIRNLIVAAAKLSGFGPDLAKEIEELCSGQGEDSKCAASKGS